MKINIDINSKRAKISAESEVAMVLFKDALEIALDSIMAKEEYERVDIQESLNRVTAEDIFAIKDLPSYNNSAMDGYAFCYSERGKPLKIAAVIYAGDKQEPILKEGECYKIMTGAKVPKDADTVAPKEICRVDDGFIELTEDIQKGSAIRLRGEELQKGSLLIEQGTLLDPGKVALLASQGITKIKVYKRLKIAIVSTGSELKEPWEEASEDEVYNINGINIQMHLKHYGIESSYIGSIPDNLEQSIAFISKLKQYDIVITTGGISVGDADFTKKAFIENGLKELFHGVRVKPGHPTMMGIMEKTFVMAMPGNPLAAIVNILLLSLAIIFKMQGAKTVFYEAIKVGNGSPLKLKPNRVNIVLGNVEDGKFFAYKDNRYGSGMITPLVKSHYIALFGENRDFVGENEVIKVIRINSELLGSGFDYINE